MTDLTFGAVVAVSHRVEPIYLWVHTQRREEHPPTEDGKMRLATIHDDGPLQIKVDNYNSAKPSEIGEPLPEPTPLPTEKGRYRRVFRYPLPCKDCDELDAEHSADMPITYPQGIVIGRTTRQEGRYREGYETGSYSSYEPEYVPPHLEQSRVVSVYQVAMRPMVDPGLGAHLFTAPPSPRMSKADVVLAVAEDLRPIRMPEAPGEGGGKATWVWDDEPPENFGQLWMPVCRTCGRGPLSASDLATGLCGEPDCVNPTIRLREGLRGIASRRCLCEGHWPSTAPHGGPCCGVADGLCVTCEARALLEAVTA